jgi:hypothetical protein
METRVYTAASLEAALKAFEKGYALSSKDFYDAYVEGHNELLEHVMPRHRVVWATFYERWRCMSGQDFADRIERELEPA